MSPRCTTDCLVIAMKIINSFSFMKMLTATCNAWSSAESVSAAMAIENVRNIQHVAAAQTHVLLSISI